MNPPPEGATTVAVSPSLQPEATAYEVKFHLDAARTVAVEGWARQHLELDPHGDPARGGAYRIHSVYLDTPALDVFHRAASYRRRKYRLRRYGEESWLYLERKTKAGDQVWKRRSVIPANEVGLLQQPEAAPGWVGGWFHQRVTTRRLRPTLGVGYDRLAFVGHCEEGDLRLTLDRALCCVPVAEWSIPPVAASGLACALSESPQARPLAATNGSPAPRDLLGETAILELKFHGGLPLLFRRLLLEMGLYPAAMSKYRQGVEAWGLARRAADGGMVV